jgi:biotin carboxyl carrier protein
VGIYSFVIDGNRYEVEVGDWEGNRVQVTVNGTVHLIEVNQNASAQPSTASNSVIPSPLPPVSPTTAQPTPKTTSQPVVTNGALTEVRSPMVGQILSIKVAKGKSVKTGDQVLVLEAMKMENIIYAPIDGVVETVAVQVQQTVVRGDLLVTIRPK